MADRLIPESARTQADDATYPDGLSRDVTCGRCRQQTNNSSQGHYWSWCKVTRQFEGFHFCCPGACEFGEPVPPHEPSTQDGDSRG